MIDEREGPFIVRAMRHSGADLLSRDEAAVSVYFTKLPELLQRPHC
jgi:hypothetical protein